MPGGDRTGPRGEGPMTGRGAGYCNGFNSPGNFRPGGGFRRGNRHRNMYYSAARPARPVDSGYSSEDESKELELKAIKNQLESIEKRLEELNEN
ncbi:MAG: DUF5320 domain-containing protein [Bacillota bacterium]